MTAARMEEQHVAAGLHARVWPGDAGLTVVALAGLGSCGAVWAHLADQLDGAHIVAPDLRGRGGSQHLAGPPGLRSHARDVADVLAELDLRNVVVVGHSMGAYLAPVVAQEAPDRVRKIVCVDGGIPPRGLLFSKPALVRASFGLQMRIGDREWATVEAFASKAKLDQSLASRPDLRPLVMAALAADLGDGVGPWRPRLDTKRAVADAVDALCGADVASALEALRVPADVILAENLKKDGQRPFISDQAVRSWTARQPLLRVRRVPGNHITALFAPEVADAVLT